MYYMKKKIVLAFGTFDILHIGHIHYLEKAKKYGDVLGAVIARDSSIRMFKNREPVFNEIDRLSIIKSLKVVDFAVLGNDIKSDNDKYKIIKKFKPDVIVFGYDQKVNLNDLKGWLKFNKLNTKIVKIKSGYIPSKYKSSIIRKTLK